MKLLYLLVLVLLTSCAAKPTIIGRDFDNKLVSNIVDNNTNKSDIVNLFGHPYDKKNDLSIIDQKQLEKYLYYYQHSDPELNKTFYKVLVIVMSGEKVTYHNYYEKEDIGTERAYARSSEKLIPIKGF